MKKNLKTMLALVAGTMAVAACSDDAIIENNESQLPEVARKHITLTAVQEDNGATRAAISSEDSKQIVWTEGDKITVLYRDVHTTFGFDNVDFTLTGGANTTNGTFDGEVLETVTDETVYTALYPCHTKNEGTIEVTWEDLTEDEQYEYYCCLTPLSREFDQRALDFNLEIKRITQEQYDHIMAYVNGETVSVNNSITLTADSKITDVSLPAVQTATEGSFDPSTALMMAQTTGSTDAMKFKNVVSYFKFVAPFDCSQVKIIDNASAGKMAGTVTLTYNAGEPTAEVTANGASSITLTGTIEQGKTYYIATLPQTFSQGIKMYFVKSDGTEYVKSTSSSYTLGRNKVSNMGTPALGDENIINPPYVTFSAASSQTLWMSAAVEGLEYSVGGGAWATLGTSTVAFGNGNDLRLRGTNGWGTGNSNIDYSNIIFGNYTTPVACTGDIRTLVDYINYETASTANARFYGLFKNCSELTSAPLLPATQLANNCYSSMFYGCTKLTTAPDLPATQLANGCYSNMFYACTRLTTAPALPATQLADNCYAYMFAECYTLVNAPALPATTLANSCYSYMFNNCSSMVNAPELPATTLANYCYNYMFKGCSELNYVKAAFTSTPGSGYTTNWLQGVASTGTFVKNLAATWDVRGASGVPEGWTVEVVIPKVAWENALTLGKSEATSIVLEIGVATKPAGAHNLNSAGTLWEVLDGTTLRIQSSQGKIIGSYNPNEKGGLFHGYSKAETITGLDKLATEDMTTMARMFFNCKALTGLNLATFNTAKVENMWQMFYGCEKLTSLDLSTFNIKKVGDVSYMFCDCKTLTSLTVGSDFVLPAATATTHSQSDGMFLLNPDGDKNNYKGMCIIYGATEEVKTSLKQLFYTELYYVKFEGE